MTVTLSDGQVCSIIDALRLQIECLIDHGEEGEIAHLNEILKIFGAENAGE